MQVYLQCSGGMIGWFITGVYITLVTQRQDRTHTITPMGTL